MNPALALGLFVAAEMAIMRYTLNRGMVDIDLWVPFAIAIAMLFGPFWGIGAANLMIWFAFATRPDDTIPTIIASVSASIFLFAAGLFWNAATPISTLLVWTFAYEIILNTACYPFDPDFMEKVNVVMVTTFISWLFYSKVLVLIL